MQVRNEKIEMKTETKGIFLGFIGITIFSLTLPATRYIAPYFDPIFIGLGRASIAALFAAVILLIFKQAIPNKQQLKLLTITTMGVVIGFPVLTSWAMQTVHASHAGVVIALIPLMTAVIARFISGERPSFAFWLLSIIGATLVASYALLQGNLSFQIGDLLLIAGSILGALGYAVGGSLSQELGGWQVICWALVISFPFIIIPTLITQPDSFNKIPSFAWLNFLYLALMSQLLGFFFWYKGLAIGGIARVSQTQLAQPFLTIIASALFLGESIDATTLIFAVAVISIIAISRKIPIKTAIKK